MAENSIIEQAKGFFFNLPRIQKIVFGVIAAAVIIGAGLLIATRKTTEYSTLYTSLDPAEASKIVESLKVKKIDYKLEENGSTILVDKSKVYDTRLSLAGEGLPAQGGVGYELFDKTNLGMSEFVQKLNSKRALEGELARTIGSLEEVKKVRVHLVIPEKVLFKKDEKEPGASVTLHLKSGRSLNKVNIEGIQNIVSSSVEGLKKEKVIIVDSRGKILSEPPLDESTVAGMTSAQNEIQRNVERNLTDKVQTLLDGVVGPDNAKVRVNAELDFTQVEKTITDFNPDRQVVRSEQNIQEKSASQDSLSYPAVNQQKNQSNDIRNYEIAKSVEHIIQSAGNIKRLTVSALVNGSVKIVTDPTGKKSIQYKPRAKDDMDQLTLAVKNSVGYDPTRNDQISVMNVAFDTSLEEQEIEETQPVPWFKDKDIIKLIAMGIVMLLTILIMFRLLQSQYVKRRMRIAMGLPDPKLIALPDVDDEADEEEEEAEEEMDELSLDEDDLLLLPADLPEQLLLEGEHIDDDIFTQEEEEEDESVNLMDRAKAALDIDMGPDLSEENLMKLEIKDKVETFMDERTDDAVKIIRLLLGQDFDEKNFK